MHVERARSQAGIVVPDRLQKGISGLHGTSILDQAVEEQKPTRSEMDTYSGAPYLGASQVHFDVVKLKMGGSILGHLKHTAEQSFDPRHQFPHVEWLCDIIVRPEPQTYDFVHRFVPCSQHENWRCKVPLP